MYNPQTDGLSKEKKKHLAIAKYACHDLHDALKERR